MPAGLILAQNSFCSRENFCNTGQNVLSSPFLSLSPSGPLFKCHLHSEAITLNLLLKKNCHHLHFKISPPALPSLFFSAVQSSRSVVSDSATPRTTARRTSLSITNSQSPPKPMSIESLMPSTHLILCRPLLLPPSIPPSIRVFSNESALHIR